MYDLRQPLWMHIGRRHVSLIDLKPGDRLLDVGSGTGNNLVRLFRHYRNSVELYGIEPSEDMNAQAEARLGGNDNVHLRIGIAEKISYEDNYFDWVVSSLVAHHLPLAAKEEMFGEMYRVLKSGGKIVITDWGKPTNLLGKVIAFLERNHAYVQEHSRGVLLDLLKQTGFKNIHDNYVQFGVVHHFSAIK